MSKTSGSEVAETGNGAARRRATRGGGAIGTGAGRHECRGPAHAVAARRARAPPAGSRAPPSAEPSRGPQTVTIFAYVLLHNNITILESWRGGHGGFTTPAHGPKSVNGVCLDHSIVRPDDASLGVCSLFA